VDDAEAVGIAVGPFEVVEKRPGEIPAQWDSVLQRFVGGANMSGQIVAALGILGRVGFVEGISGSVLGDE
jgi:hypothetical protein